MSSLRITFHSLLLICSVSFAAPSAVWNLGAGIGLFSRAGNIAVLQPVIDYDVSIIRTHSYNALWQLTANRFIPGFQRRSDLNSGGTTSIFLLRGAPVRWKGYSAWLKTGLGIGQYIKKDNESELVLGTLGIRVDLFTELYSILGMRLEWGVSYIGTVIPSSAYYTDRFGFGVVIVSSPLLH